MKKILFTLFAVLVGLAFTTEANAQLPKQMEKACKKKVKELKKGGWEVMSTSLPLEMAIYKHYEKLANDKEELVAEAKSTNKSIGQSVLLNNAMNYYATMLSSEMKGATMSQMGSQVSTEESNEIASFWQGFANKVVGSIKGEIKPSYTVFRQTKDAKGKPIYEFQAFFLVDVETAHAARMKALKLAMEEAKAHQKMAKDVLDLVNEVHKEDIAAEKEATAE